VTGTARQQCQQEDTQGQTHIFVCGQIGHFQQASSPVCASKGQRDGYLQGLDWAQHAHARRWQHKQWQVAGLSRRQWLNEAAQHGQPPPGSGIQARLTGFGSAIARAMAGC